MGTADLQQSIRQNLEIHGPMLGKELCERHGETSYLAMWQACYSDLTIQISHFSRYYLRYDITRDDYVRLSPSILRDFLSFTLFSLPVQRDAVIARQVGLSNHHREVSIVKIRIAQTLLVDILGWLPPTHVQKVCAFIAGDLAYFLGHDEPRKVKQTGDLVNGSDIDIIIVHEGLDDDAIRRIDDDMLTAKQFYLRSPMHRHEVDYICKPLSRMYDQFAYDDIHQKIASKIVYESLFLAGSLELYGRVRDEMEASGAQMKIENDFDSGLAQRKDAMQTLLKCDPNALTENIESLFYFSQERIEFT
ncbi:MAG: hypothetical protein AAF216_08230 [Pseudomonadota bacterium]